ncbi:7-cyano-7-deazaguanine synthase QueC [candidate division GN15 bacterium]|uniref:7-cyano-7-deazaguanine synthase n=1 Tax=candidate division GN15 bacterium TaxID=2072418 RepID=A0A855X6L0_9BACT|nr:MAG: 7-cyano-7-deazaguanine synthase QueC [candidate division GN15 bacterium]
MANVDKLKKPAVVLLSGGIDSSTTLAVAIDRGFDTIALSFDYGQRHRVELEAARRVAESQKVKRHIVFPLNLAAFGGSALTADISVPKHRDPDRIGHNIPITYVPARNTIFLSIALALAEVIGAATIFIGANAVDYSGYPDCRPEFIDAFETMANLATRSGVEGRKITVAAPLIDQSKAEIIKLGTRLGLDYSLTLSCYDPDADGRACGGCDSCLLRRKGFLEAGILDPTRYAAAPLV